MVTSQIALFGVHHGVTRLMSAQEEPDKGEGFLSHGYLLVVATSLSAVVTLTLSRNLLGQLLNDPSLGEFLILLLPFLVLNPIRHISYSALRATNQSRSAVLSQDIAGRVLPISLLCAAIALSRPTLGAVVFWVGTPLIITITSLYFLRDVLSVQNLIAKSPNPGTLSRIWSFSWPLAISAFVFIFLSNTDILMIGYFLNSDSVGYYRAIQPLKQAAIFLTGSFSFLFLPLATEYFEDGNMEGLQDLYTISTKWMTLGTFPIVLVFGLFSDDVVRTFFGTKYLPAASVLTLLITGLFFRTIVGLNGDMVKALDRTKIELWSAAAGLATNLGFNVILIPRYGINGAAIGTVVGYLVYNCGEVLLIFRVTGVHPFSLNNIKPLIPPLLFAFAISEFTSDTQLNLIVLLAIGILLLMVQVVSVVATRSLGPADIHIIERVEAEANINLDWVKSMSTE